MGIHPGLVFPSLWRLLGMTHPAEVLVLFAVDILKVCMLAMVLPYMVKILTDDFKAGKKKLTKIDRLKCIKWHHQDCLYGK